MNIAAPLIKLIKASLRRSLKFLIFILAMNIAIVVKALIDGFVSYIF